MFLTTLSVLCNLLTRSPLQIFFAFESSRESHHRTDFYSVVCFSLALPLDCVLCSVVVASVIITSMCVGGSRSVVESRYSVL